MDIVQVATNYLANNAAESGADELIRDLIDDLIDEVERLRGILVEANNRWRHDFSKEVEDATDKLFKMLSANQSTKPFNIRR